MDEAELTRLTIAHYRAYEAEWAAYLARPSQDRDADQEKVDATYQLHSIWAARDIVRVLGMQMPPDKVCDTVGSLEARRPAGDDTSDDPCMREAIVELSVSDAEIKELLAPRPPLLRRVDR